MATTRPRATGVGRLRRPVRALAARLLAAAAVLLAALGVAGTALAQSATTDPALGRPAVFAGIAAASAIFQTTNRNNGLAQTSEPLYGSLPDAVSVFGSDTYSARGSIYYPGATFANLGTLICVAGGPCNLPSYPLDAYADGSHPSTSVKLSGPLGGAGAVVTLLGGGANAAAAITGTASNSDVSGFTAGPAMTASQSAAVTSFLHQVSSLSGGKGAAALASGAVVRVQSMEAHTQQAFQHTATLVTHAESRASGIDVLGGMIHIDSVFATSTFENDGQSMHRHDDNVTVSGVSVAGQPAAIDANGITILGSGQGKVVLDTLNGALKQALTATGVQLHALGHTDGRSSLQPQRCSAGEVDGLEVFAPANVNSVPIAGDVYHTEVVLGGACTDAAASADRVGADNGANQPVPPATDAAPPTPLTGTALVLPSELATTSGAPTAGAVRRAPQRRTRHANRRSFLESDLRGSLVTHRVELLYLAFTLAFFAICLGVRPFLPSRLPAGP
jgi:hypothetical protein